MLNIWTNSKNGVEAHVSTKEEGNLSFKWNDDFKNVVNNREKWFERLNYNLDKLITVNQPHGNNVVIVDNNSAGRGAHSTDWLWGYDGLVTKDSELILGIETADCLPLFLFDEDSGVVGLAHAGWRGVVKNIASELVQQSLKLGAKKEKIQLSIGPHIQSCCFEIQADLVAEFRKTLNASVETRAGLFYVDLQKIVISQLTGIGILEENITASKDCSCCLKDRYYSFRRDKSRCKGSMLSIIKLKT